MVERTPRLGLNTYEPGDESWDHTDAVEAVDEHAIVHGPREERPDRGEYDDELYHATDQGLTWRWDASSTQWVYFSGRGSDDDPVPGTSHFKPTDVEKTTLETATVEEAAIGSADVEEADLKAATIEAATLEAATVESADVREAILKTAAVEEATVDHVRTAETPVWNVEAHGIEGDRSEVGEAVHELLAAVEAAGGGIVYFPPGRYCLERTPLIGDDTFLVGAGSATVLEGTRPDGEEGRALLSNTGYDEPGYGGASNWGVRNVRIDSPASNGIMPAHAENVRIENVYGDRIYHHHVDVVSSKNVAIDGYWATRGGDGGSDAPIQFDNQTAGTTANGVWDGRDGESVADDGTPTKNCTLENFEIDPENAPEYGVHLHRDGNESITIRDGYVTGCRYTAIRVDPGAEVEDLTIDAVSCIDNARGITLGHLEAGRRELTISNVTIRTDDDELAAGSGLYASGFDGAAISNVVVDGAFTNAVIFDDVEDLKLSETTAKGPRDQAFRFRENVDATLTTARAADCSSAGIYVGPGSAVAYGGVTFENVGEEVVVDGELRAWVTSSPS